MRQSVATRPVKAVPNLDEDMPARLIRIKVGPATTDYCAPQMRISVPTRDDPSSRGWMKVDYTTGPLSRDRIAQAFPVVRETAGDLTLQSWSEFARPLVAHDGDPEWPVGIIVADLDGYIRGLFTYQVVPDLRHRRTLVISNLVVLHMVARKNLADALLDSVRDLARRHRCGAVHAHVHPKAAWAVGYFEERGHNVERLVLCRPLARPF